METVFALRSGDLAFYRNSRGKVGELDATAYLIYILPSVSSASDKLFFQVTLFDPEIFHFFSEGFPFS
jgi:hypothetical protein